MYVKNYTPIEDLISKINSQSISLSKESEPIVESRKILAEGPLIQEVGKEQEISEEVKLYIKKSNGSMEIPPDLKKFGLTTVSPSNPSIFTSVKLPISDDKVMQGLSKPVTSSWRWLSELSLFLLHRAKLTLKMVRGKAVRVVR